MSTKLARGATCTPTIKPKTTLRRLLVNSSDVLRCACPAETAMRGPGLVTRGPSALTRAALAMTKNVRDSSNILFISKLLGSTDVQAAHLGIKANRVDYLGALATGA